MLYLHEFMQSTTPPTAHIESPGELKINNDYFRLIRFFVKFNDIFFVLFEFYGFFCLFHPTQQFLIFVVTYYIGKSSLLVIL
jgi:hypothetical protein